MSLQKVYNIVMFELIIYINIYSFDVIFLMVILVIINLYYYYILWDILVIADIPIDMIIDIPNMIIMNTF